jgi:hypothetical protein
MSNETNLNLKNLRDGLDALYEAASNLTTVTTNENSGSLEFVQTAIRTVENTGLVWKDQNGIKKLIYRTSPDRIWSSESIDLKNESYYAIGNVPVLRLNELGNTVVNSNLRTLGTVKDFKTTGDFVLDHYIYWNSNTQRLGIGTDAANGALSIVSLDSEFIVDHKDHATYVGTWTTNDLAIITDNTPRITVSASGNVDIGNQGNNSTKVSLYGRLGIGITNVDPNVSLETNGPVRIDGKRIQSGTKTPDSGYYKKGDLIWNADPRPSSYVGWICVRDGTPGIWKPFGKIAD